MDNEELRKYRTKLYRDANGFKVKPERVPLASGFSTWKILDYGCKLSEAMNDYELMEKVVRYHQETYGFDNIGDAGTRNAFRVLNAMGSTRYQFNDETGGISYDDANFCEHEELEEMAGDLPKFMWEKAMGRKYPFWNDEFEVEKFQTILKEKDDYFKYFAHIWDVLHNEYAMPFTMAPNPSPRVPMEDVFNYIRGLKGMALDMRRDSEKLDLLLETLAQRSYYPALEKLKEIPCGRDENYCFDLSEGFLFHNFVNIKQWDKYAWAYLKPVIDIAVEKDKAMQVSFQGTMMRFRDYFADYPKGYLTVVSEQDDIFGMRRDLPNVALSGGMRNEVLGYGTKEDCLNLAQKLIDELGGEGGFMMTNDKIGSFWADAKPENLKAVCDYVIRGER